MEPHHGVLALPEHSHESLVKRIAALEAQMIEVTKHESPEALRNQITALESELDHTKKLHDRSAEQNIAMSREIWDQSLRIAELEGQLRAAKDEQ